MSWQDLLDASISAVFDANPIRFRERDERGVAPVRKACKSCDGSRQVLALPLARNAFLCGCLDLIGREPVEHLVLGFGCRSGATTILEEVGHLRGSQHQVAIPAPTWDTIRDWLSVAPRGEVLLVHNHPSNVLNVLFDNLPMPSVTDREVWWRAAITGLRIRFYVVENDCVSEFRTPSLSRIGNILRGLSREGTGAGS